MDYATDEERVEELKKWWKENGKSVIFGVALGLSILVGWRWWQDYQVNQSVQASTLYSQLEQAIQLKKAEQIQAYFDEIKKQYDQHIYAVYAAMSMAKLKMDEQKPAEAAEILQWAIQRVQYDDLAMLLKLRLARVYLSMDKMDEALKLVETQPGSSFKEAFAEVKGDILVKQGKPEEALKAYQTAMQSNVPGRQLNPALQFKIDDLNSL